MRSYSVCIIVDSDDCVAAALDKCRAISEEREVVEEEILEDVYCGSFGADVVVEEGQAGWQMVGTA